MTDLLHGVKLCFRGLRAVGRTGSLALAGVLAPVSLITAALTFAVVLAFAGMLGELFLRDDHHSRNCRGTCSRFGMAGDRLSVKASGSAAEEADECRGQCKIAYGAGFHEVFLSIGPGGVPGVLDLTRMDFGREELDRTFRDAFQCRTFEAPRRDWLQVAKTLE